MKLGLPEELLLLFEKNADNLIEQTRIQSHETLEYKLNNS